MRIAIGSDHAGFELKETLRAWLVEMGHDVVDVGTHSEERCDYPHFGAAVGHAVADGEVERGVTVCGSGQGIAMAANKIRTPSGRANSRPRNCTSVDTVFCAMKMSSRIVTSEPSTRPIHAEPSRPAELSGTEPLLPGRCSAGSTVAGAAAWVDESSVGASAVSGVDSVRSASPVSGDRVVMYEL